MSQDIPFSALWNHQPIKTLKELSKNAILSEINRKKNKSYLRKLSILPLELREYICNNFDIFEYNDIKKCHVITGAQFHTKDVTCIANDGNFFITGSKDKNAKVWYIRENTCTLLATLEHDHIIVKVALNIETDLAIVITSLYYVYLWDIRIPKIIHKFYTGEKIYHAYFMINEYHKKIFFESFDNIRILDINSMNLLKTQLYCKKLVEKNININISCENDIILTKFINEIGENKSYHFSGLIGTIKDLDISSNGKYLICCSSSNQIIGWNTDTMDIVLSFSPSKITSKIKFIENNCFIAIVFCNFNFSYYISCYKFLCKEDINPIFERKIVFLDYLSTFRSSVNSLNVKDSYIIIGSIDNSIYNDLSDVNYTICKIINKNGLVKCILIGSSKTAPLILKNSIITRTNISFGQYFVNKGVSITRHEFGIKRFTSNFCFDNYCVFFGRNDGKICYMKIGCPITLEQKKVLDKLKKCKKHNKCLVNEYYFRILDSFESSIIKKIISIYRMETTYYIYDKINNNSNGE